MAGTSVLLSWVSRHLSTTGAPASIRLLDARHGALERARLGGDRVVGRGRGAVERDLHRQRGEVGEPSGHVGGDPGAVGEQPEGEVPVAGGGGDVPQVVTGEDLAAGEGELHRAEGDELVEQVDVLVEGQLVVGVVRRVVTHDGSAGCSRT